MRAKRSKIRSIVYSSYSLYVSKVHTSATTAINHPQRASSHKIYIYILRYLSAFLHEPYMHIKTHTHMYILNHHIGRPNNYVYIRRGSNQARNSYNFINQKNISNSCVFSASFILSFQSRSNIDIWKIQRTFAGGAYVEHNSAYAWYFFCVAEPRRSRKHCSTRE